MPVCHLVYCGQTVTWIKMTLGTEVGLGPGNIVLDGDLAPPQKRCTAAPTFRSMSIVAKLLDASTCHLVRLGLRQGHIVLDGTQIHSLRKRHTSPPVFAHVYRGQRAGGINMPLGKAVGLGPGDIVLDGDLPPLTEMGTAAPTFRPMSIVAKRSPIPTAVELL